MATFLLAVFESYGIEDLLRGLQRSFIFAVSVYNQLLGPVRRIQKANIGHDEFRLIGSVDSKLCFFSINLCDGLLISGFF